MRLTDQICQVIKERIFSGQLRPGDRVVEQKLAREFGIGQNAVREALIELAHLGFVRRVPNKGTYITNITVEDARKIARVRGVLEGLVVELISERLKHEELDLQHAEKLLAAMYESLRSDDAVSFYDYDIQFHRILWELAGNEYLCQLLEQIVVPLFAFFIMINLHPASRVQWFMDAVSSHEKVIAALKTRSTDAARQAIGRLMGLSLQQQQDMIHEEESGQPAGAQRPEAEG
jgi:DNA-binding GntR family transcriptional regulator